MAIIRLPSFNSAVLRRSGTTVSAIAGTLAPLHKLESRSGFSSIFARKYKLRVGDIKPHDRKRLAQTLNAVRAAFILVWPKCQYGLDANKANLDALSGYTALCDWILRTWESRGEKYVAQRLKSLCDNLRFSAVPAGEQLGEPPKHMDGVPWTLNGAFDPTWLFRGSIRRKAWSARAHLRFSRASRAFPAGSQWSSDSALEKHRIAMTSSPVTPVSIADLTRRIVATVVGKSLSTDGVVSLSLSSSASYESPVRKGGAAAHVREQLWSRHAEVAYSVLPGTELDDEPELYLGVVEGLPHEVPRWSRLTRKSAAECSFGGTVARVIPEHRIVAIPDRGGFKTRVISAGPACLQLLAHDVRKLLYHRVLPKTPTMWALRNDGVKAWLRQLLLPPAGQRSFLGDWVALSSDLSAATDRFPHDIVEAVNDSMEANGIHENFRTQWIAWRSLSGPQVIHYGESDVVTTSCGNLMGTAPSWFHLNMINLSAIRIAWATWSVNSLRERFPELMAAAPINSVLTADLERRALTSFSELRNPFAFPRLDRKLHELTCIVGDDLCAACPFGVAVLYEVILRNMNAELSPGKHYVQAWADGNLLLVAEEFAIIEGDRSVPVIAEHLRGIISIAESRDLMNPQRPEVWSQVGSVLSSTLETCRPTLYKPLCSIAHDHLSDLRRALLRAGLPVYLPISVGGLGWPHPRGMAYAMDRTAIHCLHYYSRIRGLRADPVQFAIAIARTRACWMPAGQASSYSQLATLFRGYASHWRYSRNSDGSLAALTPDGGEIGLCNAEEDVPSIALERVIDTFCSTGVAVRYLSDLESLDNGSSEALFRGIQAAKRRYARLTDLVRERRSGHVPPRLPRSSYVDFVRSDEELLSSLHVRLDTPGLADLVPSLFGPDAPGAQMSAQPDHPGESGPLDTLYLMVPTA